MDASVLLFDSLSFLSQRESFSIPNSQVLRLHNSTVTVWRDSIQVSKCKSSSFPQSLDGPFFLRTDSQATISMTNYSCCLEVLQDSNAKVVNLHPNRELVPIISLEVVAQPACQGRHSSPLTAAAVCSAHAVGDSGADFCGSAILPTICHISPDESGPGQRSTLVRSDIKDPSILHWV